MNQNASEGVRKPVLYTVVFLVVAVAGAVVFKRMNRAPVDVEPPPPDKAEAAPRPGYTPPKPIHTVSGSDGGEAVTDPAPIPQVVATIAPKATPPQPAALAAPQVQPSPETRSLVSTLASIDLNSAPLTPSSS